MTEGSQPASLSKELKQKIAAKYLTDKAILDKMDPVGIEIFAKDILEMIRKEKDKTGSSHDLEVLESSMEHLRRDSAVFKGSKPGTDDYDFARNDCKSLLDSTKKWLELEGLISG